MAGSFVDELRNAIRNAWCNALNTGYNFLDALPDPIVDSGSVPIARANRALYRMFCNNEPPPSPAPPFTGGQCAVLYIVKLNIHAYDNSGNDDINTSYYNPYSKTVMGPITSIKVESNATHRSVVVRAQPLPGTPDGVYSYGSWNKSFFSNVTVAVHSITRADGQADTCGNPPPVIEPPSPGYNNCPCNFTYTTNNNVNVSVSASLTFAPSVLNNYGDVTVPIRISLLSDNTIFGGDINLNTGDININFGNRNYPRSDREKPDSYDTPDDTPDIPPSVPDDDIIPSPDDVNPSTTRLLRACIVTVTDMSASSATTLFQDDNPDIYAPNLGYVQFLIAVGNRLAWSTDIPVKNRRHFIPCPWEGGAMQVRGTPRPGVDWTITPVYTRQENVVTFD